MTSKKASIPKENSQAEEEVVVKPYVNDVLHCEACELIFFNLDDFVAHKSEECQAPHIKSSSEESDVEIIWHSHNMTSKKATTSEEKLQKPSTSAGEDKVVVKPYLSDILRCGACELIFFNLDEFVAHKSEECQVSKGNIKKYKPSKKSSYDDYKKDYQSNSFNIEKKCSDFYCLKKENKHKEKKYLDIKIREPPGEEDDQLHCGICENCLRTEDCDECEVCLKKKSGSLYFMYKQCLLRQCIEKINGQLYQVEKILKKRIVNPQVEYFVKWKGYPDSQNGWEPEENIYSKDLIYEYEKNQELEEKKRLADVKRTLSGSSNVKRIKLENEDVVSGTAVAADSLVEALGFHQELGNVELLQDDSKNSQPLPQKNTKKNLPPLPQKSAEKNSQPLPQKSAEKNDKDKVWRWLNQVPATNAQEKSVFPKKPGARNAYASKKRGDRIPTNDTCTIDVPGATILPNSVQLIESEFPLSEADNCDELQGIYLFRQIFSSYDNTLQCLFCRNKYSLRFPADLEKHYHVIHELDVNTSKAEFNENIVFVCVPSDVNEETTFNYRCRFCATTLKALAEVRDHYPNAHNKTVKLVPESDVTEIGNFFYCGLCGHPSADFPSHHQHMDLRHNMKTYCTSSHGFQTETDKSPSEFAMNISERVKLKFINQTSTPNKNFKKPANKPIEQFIVKESASNEKPIVENIDKRDDKKIKNDVSEKNFRETEDEVFSPLAVSKPPVKSVILRCSYIIAERKSAISDESHLKKDSPGPSSAATPCHSARKSLTWKPIDINTPDTPAVSKPPGKSILRRSYIIAERQSAISDESQSHLKKDSPGPSSATPCHSARKSLTWKPIDINTPDTPGKLPCRKKRDTPKIDCKDPSWQPVVVLERNMLRNLPCRKKRGSPNIDCTQDPSWQPVVVLERIMPDFFYEEAIFRHVQHHLPKVSSIKSVIKVPPSAITFFSSVAGKRINQRGEVHFLLHWRPESIVPDTWVPDDELCYNRRKSIPVSQLPPEALQLPAMDVLGISGTSPRIEKHKRK